MALWPPSSWIDGLTNFLGYWLPKLWEWISSMGIALWAFLVAVVGLLWAVVTHIVPMVTVMLNVLSGITTGDWSFEPPSGITTFLQIANTFVPLEEFFSMLIVYGTLTTSLAIYRVVKNLIPTEAGS